MSDAARSEKFAYPVATPIAYWAVVVTLGLLAALTLYLVLPLLLLGPHLSWTLVLGALVIVTPVLYFFGSAEYRTGGQRAIVLARDTIVVPDASGADLVFDPKSTRATFTQVRVVYRVALLPMASVPRGSVIELVSARGRRRISTLTLRDASHAAPLLRDLERVLRGLAPLGPSFVEPATPQPVEARDALDDRLDEELRRLD